MHWAEDDKYFRPFLVVNPIFFSAFLMLVFGLADDPKTPFLPSPLNNVAPIFYAIGIGFIFSIIIFFTTSNIKPPIYEPFFIFLGLLASPMWIFLIATELVAILKTIGEILDISPSIMGLTVLAWGNSIGDFISNVLIARKGYGQMAMSACYAAPLTNLMIGLGIPIIRKTAESGKYYTIDSESLDNTLFIAFCFLAFNLLFSLVTVAICKFKLKKPFGVMLIILYIAFTTLAVLSTDSTGPVILKDIHIWKMWKPVFNI